MEENRERLKGCLVEYSVGTILWWNGREIVVVRDTLLVFNCINFVLRGTRTCDYAVECRAEKRKDGTGVHFENVRQEGGEDERK